MFDIGWSELLLIGIVALIAIGPKELPGALRTLGQWMGKVRRMASEFQNQFHEAMREAELADLKKEVDEMAAKAAELRRTSIRSTTSAATSRRRRARRRTRYADGHGRRRRASRRRDVVSRDAAGEASRARLTTAGCRRRVEPCSAPSRLRRPPSRCGSAEHRAGQHA